MLTSALIRSKNSRGGLNSNSRRKGLRIIGLKKQSSQIGPNWDRALMSGALEHPCNHLPQQLVATVANFVSTSSYKLINLTEVDHAFYTEVKDGEVLDKIETRRHPEDYSEELRNLVHDCLKFDPDRRPSPTALYHRVKQERDKFRDRWMANETIEESVKVYLANDELNDLKMGTWANKKRHPVSDYEPSYHTPTETPFDYKARG